MIWKTWKVRLFIYLVYCFDIVCIFFELLLFLPLPKISVSDRWFYETTFARSVSLKRPPKGVNAQGVADRSCWSLLSISQGFDAESKSFWTSKKHNEKSNPKICFPIGPLKVDRDLGSKDLQSTINSWPLFFLFESKKGISLPPGRRTKPGFENKIENCRQVCPRKIGRIRMINIILGHDVRIDWAWLRDCLFVSCWFLWSEVTWFKPDTFGFFN